MIVFFFFKLAGMPDYLDRLEADLMALRLATEEAHENSCLRRKMTLKKLYLYWRNFVSHWPKISANQKREFRGVVQMKIYEKAERGISMVTKKRKKLLAKFKDLLQISNVESFNF